MTQRDQRQQHAPRRPVATAVAASLSRAPASSTFHAGVEEGGAERQGEGGAAHAPAQECSGSFIDSVSGASM